MSATLRHRHVTLFFLCTVFYKKCTFIVAVELEVCFRLESETVDLVASRAMVGQRVMPAINSLHTADDYDLDLGIG